jgi:hypothetical protein
MELDPNIKLLVGTITFVDLEGGYWSLTDDENAEKHLVVDIPEELKKEGTKVAAIAQLQSNEMSIYMVENIVKILKYRTLTSN